MATITVRITGQCPSGGHITLSVTGDVAATVETHVNEIREQSLSANDKREMLLQLLKIHFAGMTANQIRNELTSPSGTVLVI